MSKININAYGEIENDPDLSYEILYDPASNNTFKKKRDTWKTKKIIVSTSQLLSCGTVPVALLDAPGVNKYYEWEALIEYHIGTTPYTMTSPFAISQHASTKFPFGTMGTSTTTIVLIVRPGFNGALAGLGYTITPNSQLLLTTGNSQDITNGNGRLIIKLKYKIKTLG